jgi:ketosteroid isomerase-like protein
MSEQNVELHRRFVAAFNAGDSEGFVALSDAKIEFHSVFAAVGGEVYHGHEGIRTWLSDIEDAWGDDVRLEPEAYFDLGEDTLAFQVMHGRGRHSGADVALPTATVVRWREGLAVYLKTYAHREDALGELGVTGDELEPIAP